MEVKDFFDSAATLAQMSPLALVLYFVRLLMKGDFKTREHYDDMVRQKDELIRQQSETIARLVTTAERGAQLADRAVTQLEGAPR